MCTFPCSNWCELIGHSGQGVHTQLKRPGGGGIFRMLLGKQTGVFAYR